MQSGTPRKVDLSFELATRDLKITLNSEVLFENSVTERFEDGQWKELDFSELSLQAGTNLLVIETSDPLVSGQQAYGNGDRRKISFVARGFELFRSGGSVE